MCIIYRDSPVHEHFKNYAKRSLNILKMREKSTINYSSLFIQQQIQYYIASKSGKINVEMTNC